jgi:electron transfer flavoprotein beta subunit
VRIVVLVKYVPQVDGEFSFTDDFAVVRAAASGTLNELDEHAVEAALALAGDGGQGGVSAAGGSQGAGAQAGGAQAGEVIAVTMAPETGDLALRKTFQLGVERGIRITDAALAGSDTFATALTLAAAIRKLGDEQPVDLVIAGMASSEAGGAVVPALIAQELGWPNLSFADSVQFAAPVITIKRHIDDVLESLTAKLPAVLSVTDAANTVRPPNFKLLMAARTKPIETWNLADLEVEANSVGLQGSRVAVISADKVPDKPEPPKVYDDGAGSGAKALVDFLVAKDLLPSEAK